VLVAQYLNMQLQIMALYQGATSVVPHKSSFFVSALAAAQASSAGNAPLLGLKPNCFLLPHSARIQPRPVTNHL